jgi:hypothetical protein
MMELTAYVPMPGQSNTVSVTTAPASRMPKSSPIWVTVDVRALLRMYFHTITDRGRPIARS